MTLLCIEGLESGFVGGYQGAQSGTFSVQTTVKRSGLYALRINPTLGNTGVIRYQKLGATGLVVSADVASMYASFYFRVDLLPDALNEVCFGFQGTSTGYKIYFRISTGGIFSVYDKDNTLVATGTTALATGTWYRIQALSTNGTSGAYELKINGVTELSGTCNQLAENVLGLSLGKLITTNSRSVDYFYDDIATDDAAYPADGKIIPLYVIANGSTMQWTSGTNASDYQEVDDIPIDLGTTYVKCGTGGAQVALFRFTSTATAGIAGTINAVSCNSVVREDTSVTSSLSFRVRSGGNNYDSTGVNFSTAVAYQAALHATNPATSAAWTLAAIDLLEAGAIEANAVSMRMDSIWTQVHYTPAPDVAPSGSGISLGLSVGLGPSGLDFPYGRS